MSQTGAIAVIRAKLHDIRVTDADLNYQGSVTLDPEHCEAVGIVPLEFVEVWNKNSGARITTYVIWGARGSRCCVLNGAAARTCQPGDPVIIVARTSILPGEVEKLRPRIALFDGENRISRVMEYQVGRDADGRMDFRIVPVRTRSQPSPRGAVPRRAGKRAGKRARRRTARTRS